MAPNIMAPSAYGLAYAQIAGVPPQNAFYAAPVALIVYALLGRSNFLVVGATSAASVLSASAIAGVGSPADAVGLSAAVAVISGAVLVAAGLARLGFVRQLSKITGADGGDGDFFERLWALARHVSHWSLATLAVGLTALAALLALERFWPRLPAALLILVVGLAVSAGAGLEKHGVEVVGKIPSAVPVPHLPGILAADWLALAGGALGVAPVVFAETYSIAGRFAREHGQEVDADREMIAVGAANVAVGLVRGFAVSGSASRSAAAAGAGGRTPMVSLIAAALILLTGAFLTPLFTDLPEAVLGAIVIVAVRGFLRVGELRRYARLDRSSLWVALTALLGVLLFDLLPGLLLAVALSLSLFIAAASRRHVAVLGRLPGSAARDDRGAGRGLLYGDTDMHPDAEPVPGVLVLRPDGSLFFGNISRVRLAIRDQVQAAEPLPHAVVLDLADSYHLGVPVLDTLDELHHHGITLHIAHVRARAGTALDRHPLAARLGPHALHPTVDDAVRAAADVP
jgi:MFS superfamily sulfate permease-like transporter